MRSSRNSSIAVRDATSVAPVAVLTPVIVEAVGKRRKNRLPDTGAPNSSDTNAPGTSTRVYGPDGKPIKDYNDGHGPNYPPNEQQPHVHDYIPENTPPPPGRQPGRQPGRPPKPNELLKDITKRPPPPKPTVPTPPPAPTPSVPKPPTTN